MRVLAEIPAWSSPELRTGTLRRADLEAYEGLLEQLGPAQSILVAGEAPGRREIAAGMAAAAAAAGTRTALLECELAEPGLAEALGLARAPGLHEYVRGTADVEAILKPVVLAGPGSAAASEPLVCIVAGRPANDGWALLASERFRAAIEGLRASYELVVLDGPPFHDETALWTLSRLVDSTIAFVGASASQREFAVPVAGVVIRR